jgi:hypothetical protein
VPARPARRPSTLAVVAVLVAGLVFCPCALARSLTEEQPAGSRNQHKQQQCRQPEVRSDGWRSASQCSLGRFAAGLGCIANVLPCSPASNNSPRSALPQPAPGQPFKAVINRFPELLPQQDETEALVLQYREAGCCLRAPAPTLSPRRSASPDLLASKLLAFSEQPKFDLLTAQPGS